MTHSPRSQLSGVLLRRASSKVFGIGRRIRRSISVSSRYRHVHVRNDPGEQRLTNYCRTLVFQGRRLTGCDGHGRPSYKQIGHFILDQFLEVIVGLTTFSGRDGSEDAVANAVTDEVDAAVAH